jgi:hypothetical protein
MKSKILAACLAAFLMIAAVQANASVTNIAYTFDGTNMTLTSGPSLFTQSMEVGDVINLTYKADGAGSYWDFSGVGVTFGVNLGFESDSFAYRGAHGSYEAKLDGVSVLPSTSYINILMGEVHLGPAVIVFPSPLLLDEFSISYELVSSTNVNNNIGSYDGNPNDWQVWDLFGLTYDHGASFVHVPDAAVPEPSSIVLLALGGMGIGLAAWRRRQAAVA